MDSNPGILPLSAQKVPIAVLRVRDTETPTTVAPEMYAILYDISELPQHVIEALFCGLGTRQYQQLVKH